jgi:hypothetical protein
MALAAWQALDPAENDPGSVAALWPEDANILAAAREALRNRNDTPVGEHAAASAERVTKRRPAWRYLQLAIDRYDVEDLGV